MYNDVVRLDDLERLIDCSFVQVMHPWIDHIPVLLLLRACSELLNPDRLWCSLMHACSPTRSTVPR